MIVANSKQAMRCLTIRRTVSLRIRCPLAASLFCRTSLPWHFARAGPQGAGAERRLGQRPKGASI